MKRMHAQENKSLLLLPKKARDKGTWYSKKERKGHYQRQRQADLLRTWVYFRMQSYVRAQTCRTDRGKRVDLPDLAREAVWFLNQGAGLELGS